MANNPAGWFEIYVQDMPRARAVSGRGRRALRGIPTATSPARVNANA